MSVVAAGTRGRSSEPVKRVPRLVFCNVLYYSYYVNYNILFYIISIITFTYYYITYITYTYYNYYVYYSDWCHEYLSFFLSW